MSASFFLKSSVIGAVQQLLGQVLSSAQLSVCLCQGCCWYSTHKGEGQLQMHQDGQSTSPCQMKQPCRWRAGLLVEFVWKRFLRKTSCFLSNKRNPQSLPPCPHSVQSQTSTHHSWGISACLRRRLYLVLRPDGSFWKLGRAGERFPASSVFLSLHGKEFHWATLMGLIFF